MSNPIILTERAQEQIRSWLLTDRYDNTWFLRFEVLEGGCSGMRYNITLDNRVRENDKFYQYDGFKLYSDTNSMKYLVRATLDYKVNIWQSTFKIFNPQAASTCCCGRSFLPIGMHKSEAA